MLKLEIALNSSYAMFELNLELNGQDFSVLSVFEKFEKLTNGDEVI